MHYPTFLAIALLAVPSFTQTKDDDDPKKDPYTEGKQEVLDALGYVSLGPFVFADRHTTTDVEHALGKNVPLLWLETEHFKIGSTLPHYGLTRIEKSEKTRIRAELAELAERLPNLTPKKVRILDPWLRVHLYAKRLEALYADVVKRLGKTDADFPKRAGDLRDPGYRGQGPYLGQNGKYVVLLVVKDSTLGAYAQTFMKRAGGSSLRHNFVQAGNLFFGAALESLEGKYRTDTSLQCMVASQVVQNLIHGYKYYTHDLPLWWSVGLGHWYARRIDERFSFATEIRQFDLDPDKVWDWEPRVLARVRNDVCPSSNQVLGWTDYAKLSFNDNMMAWSRVDYLMSLGDAGFGTFMDMMNGPIPGAAMPPTQEQLQQRQLDALEKAWNLTPERFDEGWRAFVLDTYGKKRR